MKLFNKLVCTLCAIPLLFFSTVRAQNSPDWSEPIAPYRVIGNVYYVGTKGLASFLITTPEGHILINSGLESTPPLIQASVEELGFKFSDIKILLISHAHWDHCAGSAALIGLTGANYMVMEGDADLVEAGGKGDFHYGDTPSSFYPPTKVDRVLRDEDKVELGGTTLVAHKTPGHTKGCTTWTLKTEEGGQPYNVVIVGSPNVNAGFKLIDNPAYPQIAQDFETTFRVLNSLPCDVFLGAHGDYYGMLRKLARASDDSPNPFIDPEGYKNYVSSKERAFLAELARQQAQSPSRP